MVTTTDHEQDHEQRQRAAVLARKQAQAETREIADVVEPVLRAMSAAILALGKNGHEALALDLHAFKGDLRKTVFVYLQSLRQSAQQTELSEMHAIVDAMRRESEPEQGVVGVTSLPRMRRAMERAIVASRRSGVLDAG